MSKSKIPKRSMRLKYLEKQLREVLQKVFDDLRSKEKTLSFAESCTGGRLSAELTRMSGVSKIFPGAIVSYANEVKTSVLDVAPITLHDEGAVSVAVARQMAQGVRKLLNTDYAVALTGIAGPLGGTSAKPVGTVCISCMGPGVEWTKLHHFKGSREEIQLQSCLLSAKKLYELLSTKGTKPITKRGHQNGNTKQLKRKSRKARGGK